MTTLFNLPNDSEADLVLIPVCWEGTVSYGKGTSQAPMNILKASTQIDVDREPPKIHMLDPIKFEDSNTVNEYVYNKTKELMNDGKFVGLIGGEHSIIYGSIKVHLEKYPDMGILHIDAHHDLRLNYQGLEHSHANIMRHAINMGLKKLVSVYVRDYHVEEADFVFEHSKEIQTYYANDIEDTLILDNRFTWKDYINQIRRDLPENVYISFDIDGLDLSLCPGTGTPVPGGMSWYQAKYLLEEIGKYRNIIGFDLVEVGPTEYDANVGMRVLYNLCKCVSIKE